MTWSEAWRWPAGLTLLVLSELADEAEWHRRQQPAPPAAGRAASRGGITTTKVQSVAGLYKALGH